MKRGLKKLCLFLLFVTLTVPAFAGRVLAEIEYFYADDGTLIGKAFNGKRVNFEYDLRGQLLAVKDASGKDLERYTYDPAGNRLSKTINGVTTTYTYDKANQLATSTVNGKTTHYKYDAAGRMIQAGDKKYIYNGQNKVAEVRQNGKTIAKFEYNIDGQIAKAIYGDKVEEFMWDGLALIWRSGVTYINEPYVTGGNPVMAGDDVLFNDMLGSTLAINSKAVEMTSFGETTDKNAFFTGKPMIDELGYSFLFRDYNPNQGKWTNTDPLGYPDGWNNLAYCNNEVITAIDKQGTDIYHVTDISGIGHSATIIGNPIDGYYAYNNGPNGGGYGPGNPSEKKYNSAAEALAELNRGRPGSDEYDLVQKWDTSRNQDALARSAAKSSIDKGYDPDSNNCMHTVALALEAAAVNYFGPGSSYVLGLGIAWCPPQRFYTANLLYAQYVNYNDFKNGKVE